MALLKDTQIREQMRLEFRCELFNAFNHAQFQSPDGNIADLPTAGNNFTGTFGRSLTANSPTNHAAVVEAAVLANAENIGFAVPPGECLTGGKAPYTPGASRQALPYVEGHQNYNDEREFERAANEVRRGMVLDSIS